MMNVAVRSNDRFVTVDGLNIRYLEEGSGVPAILLHGASLGSSADVFRRNLNEFGAKVELRNSRYTTARRTDEESAAALGRFNSVGIFRRRDGAFYALFESPYWLQRIKGDHPEITLEPILQN